MGQEGPSGRRKREAEILGAAVEIFRSKGYALATIQDIADHVGVLKGSLYYYIRSKEELLSRIFDEINAEAREILLAAQLMQDRPPLERLAVFIERYTYWYLTHLERVGLYFSEWRYLTGELLEKELARRAEFEMFIRALIEEAKATGAIGSEVRSEYSAFFLLGGVNSAATWYHPDGADSPSLIANSFARMAVGLLTPPAIPPVDPGGR